LNSKEGFLHFAFAGSGSEKWVKREDKERQFFKQV
jgi:hypothetical protein